MSNEPSWPDDAPDWLGWAVFVGPLAVYFAVGALVPSIWERVDLNLNVEQSSSVALVCVIARLCLVGIAVVLGLRLVTRCFPFSVTPWAVGIGVVGGAILDRVLPFKSRVKIDDSDWSVSGLVGTTRWNQSI